MGRRQAPASRPASDPRRASTVARTPAPVTGTLSPQAPGSQSLLRWRVPIFQAAAALFLAMSPCAQLPPAT